MNPPTTIEEFARLVGDDVFALRFIEKVRIAEPPPWAPELGPCIMWTKATETTGYGTFRGNDPPWDKPEKSSGAKIRQRNAHIWLFERLNGRRVLPGHELDHICHDWRFCTPEKASLDPHRRCVIHPVERAVAENRLRANTVPGGNHRLKMRVLAGESPVWCRGKYGPHNLADIKNQYWTPKSGSLQCRGCHPHHVRASEERKRQARLAHAG